jgi:hypothetical protein
MGKTNRCILLLYLGLSLMAPIAWGQNGLKKIIVEPFYISNAADSVGSMGVLPVGSVTYRIYVQMKKGYVFETIYGNIPHPLKFSTTTAFFNNEDYGSTSPNGISVANEKKNTVMLDSWLSAGGAANGRMGVLKSDDTTGSIGNINGLLQNTDPMTGIPVKVEDGMMPGSPCAVTFVGLSTTELSVLDAVSNTGNLFTTNNGAWACLSGIRGPNPDTNRVLVAQITTNGTFSFQMNVQIGDTATGNAENYVYNTPTGNEVYFAGLSYTSPTINSGINEKLKLFDSYILFPNPAKDAFSLQLSPAYQSSGYQYAIYDLLGKLIVEKSLPHTSSNSIEHIDISSLANGMYVFILQTADGLISSRKLIKNQ